MLSACSACVHARHTAAWFYRGPFALKTERWMSANGGLITREDLAGYNAKRREPVRTTYRGHEIVGFPPPSSGGWCCATATGAEEEEADLDPELYVEAGGS